MVPATVIPMSKKISNAKKFPYHNVIRRTFNFITALVVQLDINFMIPSTVIGDSDDEKGQ